MKHSCPVLFCLLLVTCSPSLAQEDSLRLPAIFGDHMVMQRGRPLTVWGWGPKQQTVQVSLGNTESSAEIDETGKWCVTLPAQESDEPLILRVSSADRSLERKDILLGEVWICSGQSNMEWPLSQSHDAAKEVADANQPRLRFFHVEHATAPTPQQDCRGTWQVCTSETASSFSAVGYYFARKLARELQAPIGMIGSYWGGTPAESWTSREALQSHAALAPFVERPNAEVAAQNQPSMLFNAMVNPLIPFSIRGAIWYQGESNVGRAHQYATLFPTMIRDWRFRWREGDFPFYFAQLAPFRYGWADPQACAELWEAQIRALSLPNTGIAATIDIGDVQDIHPRNKLDVGERLARWALAKTYQRKAIAFSGPQYQFHTIQGDAIRIHFEHADGLKTSDGAAPTEFSIASADGEFVPAHALIEGSTVLVSSSTVTAPAAVRFAWHDTALPNLVNSAGLPALPFRTDDFHLLSDGD